VFFCQAEDGIRDLYVTGVQTCALPICKMGREMTLKRALHVAERALQSHLAAHLAAEDELRLGEAEVRGDDRAVDRVGRLLSAREIGRGSCRGRLLDAVLGRALSG